jgi:regulator of cell morphogenesis and NO signaling
MSEQGALLAESRVCDIVTELPVRGAVLSKFGIDFCCGGKQALATACEEKGIELEEVIREIHDIDVMNNESEMGELENMSATELCDHIESRHHNFLRQHLPTISAHAEKVALVHGGREPRLKEIARVFAELKEGLEPHMMKEETILFPLIRLLDSSTSLPDMHCGSVRSPIRAMFVEHDSAGLALARLRELSDSYTPPLHACNTYRALFGELELLEKDTHIHIHKENHVLFVKAQEIERDLLQQASVL